MVKRTDSLGRGTPIEEVPVDVPHVSAELLAYLQDHFPATVPIPVQYGGVDDVVKFAQEAHRQGGQASVVAHLQMLYDDQETT